MIWKGSKYVGCGISYDPDVIYVVCNYDPAGNWRSRYHENVFTVDGSPWGRSDETLEGRISGEDGIDATSTDDGGPSFIGEEDREEPSTPYWMYALGFLIMLMVVVFLAILIYFQKG